MATITTLLIGAIAGAAGTWTYLRRQTQQQAVVSEGSPTAAPVVETVDPAEGAVVDTTATPA